MCAAVQQSVASNERNRDTISIEVCHPDESGQFTQAAYDSLARLTAWLCAVCGLDVEDVIRHYDVTGKLCPKYFVEHEDAWELFKKDVAAGWRNFPAQAEVARLPIINYRGPKSSPVCGRRQVHQTVDKPSAGIIKGQDGGKTRLPPG
jgi:hypothetical protein